MTPYRLRLRSKRVTSRTSLGLGAGWWYDWVDRNRVIGIILVGLIATQLGTYFGYVFPAVGLPTRPWPLYNGVLGAPATEYGTAGLFFVGQTLHLVNGIVFAILSAVLASVPTSTPRSTSIRRRVGPRSMPSRPARSTAGTGQFAYATGSLTGSVDGTALFARLTDHSCDFSRPPVIERDDVAATGTLEF